MFPKYKSKFTVCPIRSEIDPAITVSGNPTCPYRGATGRIRIQNVYPGEISFPSSGLVRPRGFCVKNVRSVSTVACACTGMSFRVAG